MNIMHALGRILLPVSLVFLAACQTAPHQQTQTAESQPAVTAGTTAPAPAPAAPSQASAQGVSVAVFLADTVSQPGWTQVKIQSGTLYVNPQPIITRADLVGVQAGKAQDGVGLLALNLSSTGQKKVGSITTDNPNKRLALVVGRTMLAAPSYTTPVEVEQLVFPVGTEENATAAARAIAGVDESGNASAPGAGAAATN